MTVQEAWRPAEGSVNEILARHPRPFEALAAGTVPAVILRGAFPLAQCRAVVRRLYERGGIEERPGITYDGVGTSLGNLGGDPDAFFVHAQETHALYTHLFDGIQHPVDFVYHCLAALAPDRSVQVAREADGRLYGPAIFRIYRAGKGHLPHFDSVRLREQRQSYAVYQFPHQFAGVLCLQAAEVGPESGEALLYRRFWSPDIQEHLQAGTFHTYAIGPKLSLVDWCSLGLNMVAVRTWQPMTKRSRPRNARPSGTPGRSSTTAPTGPTVCRWMRR